MQQAEVIQNHKSGDVLNIGQVEAVRVKYEA
jgi:hypothetical protein